jgi:hypothetical protein
MFVKRLCISSSAWSGEGGLMARRLTGCYDWMKADLGESSKARVLLQLLVAIDS